MKQTEKRNVNISKAVYTSPSVTEIHVIVDILTGSYNDSNMGEWDTEE